MTVSDLLKQPCNKSDNAIKLVTIKLMLTAYSKLVTTGNKQCEDNLLTACLQTCNNLCVFACVGYKLQKMRYNHTKYLIIFPTIFQGHCQTFIQACLYN